jgi:starch synthase (maltosyl-transferring)
MTLDLPAVGLDLEHTFDVHDLLADEHEMWHGPRHAIALDPARCVGRILRLRQRVRTERDFDYFA